MDEEFLQEAISLAIKSVASGGGPFGAVVVRDGQILGRGANSVTRNNDPTAHAEVVAIREACQALGDFRLEGATLFVSCEPCPMCYAAAYWARIGRIVYAASREDASSVGFDDTLIHEQVSLPTAARSIQMVRIVSDKVLGPFDQWRKFEGRVDY